MSVIEQDTVRLQPAYEPMLNISQPAAVRLTAMMNEKQLEGYALRVFVAGGGCSGLQYGMTFDNESREGDTTMEAHGLSVWVDSISARYLMGASIDYVDTLMGGGFKIDNPNAVSSCGCGHSFRPASDAGEEDGYDNYSDGDGDGGGCGCGSCGG